MEWISIKDRLPQDGQLCTITDGILYFSVIYKDKPFRSSYVIDDHWEVFTCDHCINDFFPTHWMPLPELPKQYG